MTRNLLTLLFLGPPGVGKGTYGKRISKKLNIPMVTAGDLIRDQISRKTDFGLRFKATAERGELIDPSQVTITLRKVVDLVALRLHEADCAKGYLLDGFPRSPEQAIMFHKKFPPFSLVVDIQLEEKYLVPKLLGRRVCTSCGNNYNIASIMDEAEGVKMPPLLPPQGKA